MNRIIKGLCAIGIAFVSLLPGIAMAAGGAGMFEPVDGDMSIQVLRSLFGGAMGGGVGQEGADPFGSLIEVFNGSAMFVAGLLASYTLIVGTMHTAHDGEALGKKWSSLWVPINIALFAGLMMPLPSGYNTGQLTYMWVVQQGIGLGDKAWSAYVDNTGNTPVAFASPNVTQLAQDTLLSLTCVEESKLIAANSPGWSNGPIGKSVNDTGYFYDSSNEKGGCGSVDFADIADHAEAQGDGILDFKSFGRGGANPQPIVNAHRVAYNDMVAKLEPTAALLAKSQAPANLGNVINAAGVAYQKRISDAVTTFNDTNSRNTVSSEDMKKDGWMLAGFYYVALAEQQNKASAAAQRIPVASLPTDSMDSITFTKEQIRLAANAKKVGMTSAKASKDGDLNGAAGKWIAEAFSTVDLDKLDTTLHPITFMADVGSRFESWAMGFTLFLVGIGITGALPFAGGATLAILTALSPMISTIWIFCITISFTLQYLIPALPAIIWVGVLVGYFVFVIEGMLGVTLLILASMSPDQDGVVGKNGQAYMLILKAMLKPFLMVFGFVVSLVLSKVLFDFLNQIFAAYLATSSSGLSSVLASLSGALIYCIIVIMLMKKCFEMVHVIPDQLMRWMGGAHGNDLGSSGQAGASGLQTATIAASTQVGHLGSNMTGGMDKLKTGMEKVRKQNQNGGGDGGATRKAPDPKPNTES